MITASLFQLLPGFAVNCITAFLIAHYVYRYSNPKNQDFRVTLLSFSALVYLVVSMLRFLDLNGGMGFGLLAVFATMNLRSVNLPIKEMTYLFIAITLAMFNSLFTNTTFTIVDRVLVNLVVFTVIYLVELMWGVAYEPRKALVYEKIEMVKPEKYAELLNDLRHRTGLNITRVEVNDIDFVRDTADLLVFYRESDSSPFSIAQAEDHQQVRNVSSRVQGLA
jgi:Domain of unknown function (DUF4956)